MGQGLPSNCRSWLIGVSIAVIANIISNLGLNFQKKAHSLRQSPVTEPITKEDDIQVTEHLISSHSHSHSQSPQSHSSKSNISLHSLDGEHRHSNHKRTIAKNSHKSLVPLNKSKEDPYICSMVWLLGLFLQILGGILDFLALGYAPQSVVAPLGSLTLVVNVFLSPCMHNQKPSFKILLFTSIIIIGAAITVAASPRNDNIESIAAVFALFQSINFVVYAFMTVSFIIIGWICIRFYVKHKLYAEHYYKYHRFFIAAISGTMGAQNILFAKSIAVIIVKSIHNNNALMFTYLPTYFLIFGLLFTIYFQLKWTNDGLQRFSPLYVAPTFQAFWITVSVFGGLIVFGEFDVMNYGQRVVFALGVLTTICGVFALTLQEKPQELKSGSITIRHYIPLLFCFLVLYLLCTTFLHSKYSLCQ